MQEWASGRRLCSPIGEKTPLVGIPGPKRCRWEGDFHNGRGMTVGTHLANGAFTSLCVDSTHRSETRKVQGLHCHNQPKERTGKVW